MESTLWLRKEMGRKLTRTLVPPFLRPGSPQSDLYVEGIDQYGGWFLSSLLTCVSLTGKSPYKDLLVHGFVVDEEGKKMSKSVGNVIDPQRVIFGNGKKVRHVDFVLDVM